MAKAKARQRALEKKRGTTGTDPFIPARNARPLTQPASSTPNSVVTSRKNSQAAVPLRRLMYVSWAVALALPFVLWTHQIGNAVMGLGWPLLATRLSVLGIVYLCIAILTIIGMRRR